jgi:hypothetical protein
VFAFIVVVIRLFAADRKVLSQPAAKEFFEKLAVQVYRLNNVDRRHGSNNGFEFEAQNMVNV